MPRHTPTPGAIVAITAEDDRFAAARHLAADLARERKLPVILYDFDAASLLDEPLPTWWSSDGWENRFPDRLDDKQLRAAGRAAIADQVQELRAVIPRDLAELNGLEALLAGGSTKPAEVVQEHAAANVVIA
jgi:hypothetical protein